MTVPGSDGAWNTHRGFLRPPINSALEGIFLLDGTRDGTVSAAQAVLNACKNRAEGKPDAIAAGAPVANARSLTLTNNTNYLQTQIAESDNMTIVVLNRGDYAAGNYVGNVQSPRAAGGSQKSYGVGMQTNAATAANGNSYVASFGQYDGLLTTVSAILPASGLYNPDDTAWMAWALRVSETVAGGGVGSTGTVTRDLLTPASRNSVVRAAGQVRDKGAGTLRIGSGYISDSSKADPITLGLVMVYSAALNDADLAATYAWLRAFAATWHGVSA